MTELTVGYVAGFIALAMFIVQIWNPNAIAFTLAGRLRDTNTAASWVVAGRTLQSSSLPDIYKTDTALTHGVRTDIKVVARLIPLMGFLIAIAGVVTPLGLYDTLGPTGSVIAPFHYIADASPFGIATPLRSNLSFSRKCSSGHGIIQGPAPCPYSDTVVIITDNGTDLTTHMPFGYDTSVPQIVSDIYSSGTKEVITTVSNYFDIQWRHYKTSYRDNINNGSAFLVGAYRPTESVILNSAIQPVEGLLVDTIAGGLGFRNHTIPVGFQHGATWTEDILFIEPVTRCVNTNLTLDFTISASENEFDFISELLLTDRGGFVNLNRTYPEYERNDPQKNPDVEGRAYKAAWLNNVRSMLFLNVTNNSNSTYGAKSFSYLNSSLGRTFPMPYDSGSGPFDALDIIDWGSYLFGGVGKSNYSNPFGVTSRNFIDISTFSFSKKLPFPRSDLTEHSDIICSGAGNGDIANISNIFGACGLMRGAPQRLNAGSSLIFDSRSKWSSPLYACASVVRATVKTVSFNFNGTGGLQSLSVTDLRAKVYSDDNSMPLWGVEDSGMANDDISPVWGLISPTYEHYPNISIIRQESLYLPGYSLKDMGYSRTTYQNMPGSDFAPTAMTNAYGISSGITPEPYHAVDYTGYSNIAMYVRWQNLSKTAEAASAIVNLIWTDLAAAAVVGTKGVLGPGNAGSANDTVRIAVKPTVRKIKYHYLFAIPAFVLAGMTIVISFIVLLSLISGRLNPAVVRQHLHQSSTGRILTTFLDKENCNMKITSKDWSQRMGGVGIDLSGELPVISGTSEQCDANVNGIAEGSGTSEQRDANVDDIAERSGTSEQRDANVDDIAEGSGTAEGGDTVRESSVVEERGGAGGIGTAEERPPAERSSTAERAALLTPGWGGVDADFGKLGNPYPAKPLNLQTREKQKWLMIRALKNLKLLLLYSLITFSAFNVCLRVIIKHSAQSRASFATGQSMAWRSSGNSNGGLIQNLTNNGLIKSERVKGAMLGVDRADYCPRAAYEDSPQSIGYSATISAPHMHASASSSLLAFLHPNARVLDIGSGSGYLTHVLANLVAPDGVVIGVDHIQELVDLAVGNMKKSEGGRALLDSKRVQFVKGDGRLGYKDGGPYDAIHVGAAAASIHQPLIDQLKCPGRMFIPVNDGFYMQHIWVVDKKEDGTVERKKMYGVSYVPLTDAPDS